MQKKCLKNWVIKSYGDDNQVANITIAELKAINKQVEELGWKNESINK